MEIPFRVVQSSSLLHGVHWGWFLPDTECLVVLKSHLVEVYQLTQEEKPLYCVLEQILGFQVAASAKVKKGNQDFLVLSANGRVNFMEFECDYFKIAKSFDTGLENIEKIEGLDNRIVCSDNQKNLLVLDCEVLNVVYHLQVKGSIFDWQFVKSGILLLEYNTIERKTFWSCLKWNFEYEMIHYEQVLDSFPRVFLQFKNFIITFTENKMVVFDYFSDKTSMLDMNQIRTLQGFYSSSTVINDLLYICLDNGLVFTFDSILKETGITIKEDSLLLNINNLLFYISHHGECGLLNQDFSSISITPRSGSFIDGFFLNEWDSLPTSAMILASVNFSSSQIIKIEKKCSEVFQYLQVKNISKYSTSACILDKYLLLMPDLNVVNIESFEGVSVESAGLISEKTLFASNFNEKVIQVTEKSVFFNKSIVFTVPSTCLAATGRDSILVLGLVSKQILVLESLSLKVEIKDVDFSTFFLSNKKEILVGLQTTGVQRFSLSGEMLEMIETKGIPNSYAEKFGRLFIGTRDGCIEIFKEETRKLVKFGNHPLNLTESNEGIFAVSDKTFLIYNENLDFKQILIPDCKFVVESNTLISISKDLIFFKIEDDLRYSTTQQVLFSVNAQINRMIMLNHSLICFSYEDSEGFSLIVFNILIQEIQAIVSELKPIKSLTYLQELNLILTGNEKGGLDIYNIQLQHLVTHNFPSMITAISFFDNHLYIGSDYILFDLEFQDIHHPTLLSNEKFTSSITDILPSDSYLFISLSLSGIRVLSRSNLSSILETTKKLDFKRLLKTHDTIFAVSIDGWVLRKSLEGSEQVLSYTGSGGRVLVKGSLFTRNLLSQDTQNLLIASLNGELLELYPDLEPSQKAKAKELFTDLEKSGIIDPEQSKELNLDILRLMLKIPTLDKTEKSIQALLQLSS